MTCILHCTASTALTIHFALLLLYIQFFIVFDLHKRFLTSTQRIRFYHNKIVAFTLSRENDICFNEFSRYKFLLVRLME
jgi:hypothetical protein